MNRPGGYALICDPYAPTVEMDTFTCHHCNSIVHILPKASPDSLGGFCRMCAKMICAPCVDLGSCTPFEKKLESMERHYATLRSYGLAA